MDGAEVGSLDNSLIIYDGDCIFCQNYVRFIRLRETIGNVELVDARSDDPRVARYWDDGFDLDEGMIFVHRGQVYYGSEAVHVLARLSSSSSVLNRLNGSLFSRRWVATLAYPLLKVGRRLTLKARGKRLLSEERSKRVRQ
jgi:predicted DCC family thiol-disulfide oxidoreductase YuxK